MNTALQSLIIWLIIAVCVYYLGRRFYRQYKAANRAEGDCAGSGCSCCCSSDCTDAGKFRDS